MLHIDTSRVKRLFRQLGAALGSMVLLFPVFSGIARADIVIPNNPSNILAVAVSSSQINLTWTDNAEYETGYTVERKTLNGSYAVVAYLPAEAHYYNDTGLAGNTIYQYRVQALGNGSNIRNSGYSDEVSATTTSGGILSVLNAPTGLNAAAVSGSQINLSWLDNTAAEQGFNVERKTGSGSFAIVSYLGSNSQSYSDTGLIENTAYTYRIQARGNGTNTTNSPYSNEASATTIVNNTSLNAPTSLTATAASTGVINLAWADNALGETAYNVERKIGSGSYTVISYLNANSQSFSDSGLIPNTTYTYRVQARGISTNSAYSNEATASTVSNEPAVLPTPGTLTATASGTQVALAWTDNAGTETGYNVERKPGNGEYVIIAYLGPNSQSYTDSGLPQNADYTYRVQARGNGSTVGCSAYSNEASISGHASSSDKIILRYYIDRMFYYKNNEGQFMDAAPIIQSNRTLLPITYVALPLGVDVDWNQAEKKVTLTRQGTTIVMWIGKNTATVNGVKISIDPKNQKVVPQIIKGRTMLPLSFVALSLDCKVDWDAKIQEVKVTYPKD